MLTFYYVVVLIFSVPFCWAENSEKNCTCVPFYQCSDDDNIISDGRGLIEVRKSQPGQCEGYFDVCCKVSITTTTEPAIKSQGCGRHPAEPIGMLLYKKQIDDSGVYQCGASIIHPKVAITAAHCLKNPGFYSVKYLSSVRPVSQAIIHTEFNNNSMHNDIAVLIVNRPFKTDKLGVVCLPPPGFNFDKSLCTVHTRIKTESGEKIGKVIHLPTIPRKDCLENLRKTRLGSFYQLHHSFVCAGGQKEEPCGGDGGSPLICPIPGLPGRYQQAGIVSWGIGCGGTTPGVYVNLAVFRDWIDEIMAANKLDINYYRY